MWGIVWCATVWASDVTDLLADAGWEHFDTVSAGEAGLLVIDVKRLETPCLRVAARVDLPAEVLMDVVTDVPAAPQITRETLIASEVLRHSGDQMDYYQHLDVPGWTLAADRFWVLRGENIQRPEGPMFQWHRFEWSTDYPELAARLAAEHPSAIEPEVNWGAWTFEETDGTTHARYHLCSDAGGRLPRWVRKLAATRTIPATVEDVVRAARRRLRLRP